MSFRVRRFLVFSTLLVSALVITHLAMMRRAQAEQERLFGRHSAQQIRGMTEPLCRALAPSEGVLRLSVDHNTPRTSAGAFYRQWEVEAIDRAGITVFEFDWDADTGELLRFTRLLRSPYSGEQILSRREAVYAAWGGLQTLGIAAKASRWQPLPAPEQAGEVWHVFWQAEGRATTIQIDRRSGELLTAQSERRTSTTYSRRKGEIE